MQEEYQIESLISSVKSLRFALTDALVTLQRVYGYAVMPNQDVKQVEESLQIAEEALSKTDNI